MSVTIAGVVPAPTLNPLLQGKAIFLLDAASAWASVGLALLWLSPHGGYLTDTVLQQVTKVHSTEG